MCKELEGCKSKAGTPPIVQNQETALPSFLQAEESEGRFVSEPCCVSSLSPGFLSGVLRDKKTEGDVSFQLRSSFSLLWPGC